MAIDKTVLLVRTIGYFLLLTTVVSILFTFWPVILAFSRHTLDNISGRRFEAAPAAVSQTQSFGSLLGKEDSNIKILAPKDPNFSIIVERIGANAPVIANVDASSKLLYEQALKRGVAHALGTAFPGESGVSYYFAHSTDTIFNVPRYNAVFYLLWEIRPQDKIVVFFANRRYDYVVTETKITEPEDVSYFTMRTDEQILVLQTCYPPGTVWKRFLVIAKPAAV
ncbi:sortase [Candidatus Curtissbacteria bacterium]|nr:sortase [Candidatus Curtissbacteria bacterium]